MIAESSQSCDSTEIGSTPESELEENEWSFPS